jgi:SpoVK/Ycf46/Vps4 family AAA+-type ATPase
MTMADIGGSEPGSGERAIREIFKAGAKEGNALIFLDECDALLWSRDKAGPDSMWMLGIINQLLLQIERYKGVVILATNFEKIRNPALKRRLDFILTIPFPAYTVRQELWTEKIPERHPCKLSQIQLNEIAKIKLTGSEIETVINRATRKALRLGKHPTYSDLFTTAQKCEAENRGKSITD